MSSLPPPNQQEGEEAAKAANEARRLTETQLTDGSLDLAGLFEQVDAEGEHHVLGHMHAKAALMALPHIGEAKSHHILEGLGIEPEEHLARLGDEQRAGLVQAVIDNT